MDLLPTQWTSPDFEEVNVGAEVTAYAYRASDVDDSGALSWQIEVAREDDSMDQRRANDPQR